jgi:sugar lactone lactonase YvrE
VFETTILKGHATPSRKPCGLAWDGEAIWCAFEDPRGLLRIDPETGEVLAELPLPGEGDPTGLEFAEGSLWQGFYSEPRIVRLDPATGEAAETIRPPGIQHLGGVTTDGAAGPVLWYVGHEPDGVRACRIDVRDAEPHKKIVVPPDTAGLAWDGRWLWVPRMEKGEVLRVDPMFANVVATLPVQCTPTGLTWDGEALWVADWEGSRLLRIEVPGA